MGPSKTSFSELPLIERYARVLGKLSEPGASLEGVLSQLGLTEAAWDKLEEDCDALLCSGELSEDETVGLLGTIAGAVQPMVHDTETVSVDFDTWCGLSRASEAGQDLVVLLEQHRISLSDYLAAQANWLRRVTTDVELRERYLRSR